MIVWGCFTGSRVSDLFRVRGTMNQNVDHSNLQDHVVPLDEPRGSEFTLQQDTDPENQNQHTDPQHQNQDTDPEHQNKTLTQNTSPRF